MGKRSLSRLSCANNGGLGCRANFSTLMGQMPMQKSCMLKAHINRACTLNRCSNAVPY